MATEKMATKDLNAIHRLAALSRFGETVREAERLAARIAAHIADHLGYDADAINWGHVGTAEAAVMSLREVAQIVGLEE